jgi:iron complex outermembrane receptor protein
MVNDYLLKGIGRQQWEVFAPAAVNGTMHFLKTFSVNYKRNLSGRMTMEVQGGYGERIATLNERYGFYLFNRFDGYDYLGNPELLNESSWNSEGTLSYFGSKVELQITPFYQRINNYIMGRREEGLSTMTIGARGVKRNINVERADLKGFDVMLLASPVPSLQWITTVKYTYGNNALGEAMPLIPPLKSVTSLRYEKKKFNVQVEWEWAAAQKHVSASFGEHQTPAYSILYLRAGLTLNSSWQFNAGVENVLDRRYREHLDWGGIPRPGRNVYFNLVYKFRR